MARVLNVILTHQGPAAVEAMLEWWRGCVPLEGVVLAFGGSRENFDRIAHPHKIFIDDPRLRTMDHQREFQSYTGILKAVATWLTGRDFTHVSFCEYDHLPLINDFNERQLARLAAEDADALAYRLHRVDGTCHPHYLYHASNPEFHRFWASLTRRQDADVTLSILGTGTFWTREAFDAIAAVEEPFPIYLEIFIPTLAHHLGFRLRDLPEQNRFVQVVRDLEGEIEEARRDGAWAVHYVKQRWTRPAPLGS